MKNENIIEIKDEINKRVKLLIKLYLKMKKKNFLVLALATMAFAACSNDDIVSGGDDGVATDPTGEAWVSLDIKMINDPYSRALNPPGYQNGSEAETKVNTVRAIFFTNDSEPVVTKDVTLTTAQAGNPGQPNGGIGEAFKVPANSKRLLIVANASDAFAVQADGTTFTDVNKALAGTAALVTANGFMMSNAKGGLEPSTDVGGDADLTLYTSASAATAKPLAINIDRVVAKVRVKITETSTVAAVTEAGWLLNVTNKKYFPVSKRIKTWNENPDNIGARGTCVTPFDQYKIGSYRIDPNYDSHPADSYTVISGNPADWNDSEESEYCLENTQQKDDNKQANTTQVLLKAKFIPKEYKMPGSGPASTTPGTGDDWMRINGGYYTFTTLMAWIEAELTSKFGADDPTSVSTPLTDAFNAYLGTNGVNIGEVALPVDDAGITTTMNNFKGKQTTLENKTDVEKAKEMGTNFAYYAAGISYYKIMIKHDDTDKAINELGEFGVVRNSVYDVNVISFKNPGYPVIPTPGDEDDEDDESWLAIQINVNPWTWYSQTEEL